jgi:hypothetical protein
MNEPIHRNSQPDTKPFVPVMNEPIHRYSQPDTQLGQSFTNDVVNQAGAGSANKPHIPSSKARSKRQQLSDLETQQNNLMALSGGYMTTDILPQYSAYQDKIDQLKRELTGASVLQGKAPEKPGIAYATLGDAYADSVLGQSFVDGVVNRTGAN